MRDRSWRLLFALLTVGSSLMLGGCGGLGKHKAAELVMREMMAKTLLGSGIVYVSDLKDGPYLFYRSSEMLLHVTGGFHSQIGGRLEAFLVDKNYLTAVPEGRGTRLRETPAGRKYFQGTAGIKSGRLQTGFTTWEFYSHTIKRIDVIGVSGKDDVFEVLYALELEPIVADYVVHLNAVQGSVRLAENTMRFKKYGDAWRSL